MNILKALQYAKRELLHSEFGSEIRVSLEAEMLLGFVLDTTREWLHTWGERKIKPSDFDKLMECVHRRSQGEPIEYIVGRANFFGETFYVDNRVLIPRPETELLVQKVQALIVSEGISDIGEIGTGSGAIAIMLALLCPDISIIASDISEEALAVAQINLNAFGVGNNLKDRIDLVCADLLGGVQKSPELLVSNPPYIANDYALPKNVRYEPDTALFGGVVGDEVLQSIIEFGAQRGIRFLACEMGYDQKERLEACLLAFGYQGDFYQDYNGLDRGFVAELKN
ncbi:peptide chain release factor N(5)-glutamine methyltransferase [Helicobacter sp. 11S02596-1]|uniref:peptide chain release factor N(5)-glutamine methyltransferase n=1 Tax=Helicobacter sp. 11S02596-1 TaxID=1476194 RepID=UPI000BD3073C|nr:peptide chain release factor N(5)-glutamine methyltransferase [Helicobacter sp. 11S02596-1]PAF45208.1 protein-(glutamine-N5) methyltransferase, release factor-specific [Helicobacter sp. 11S02596-1]